MPYVGKKWAFIIYLLVAAVVHAYPSAGICQSIALPAGKLAEEIRDSITSSLAALPKVQEVKKFTTAQQFSGAKVHLSGSERIVEQLFGRQYPVYVRFGIALRRSLLSKGAALAADQELQKLKELTRNEGATWIKSVIAALQRSTTCANAVWVDSLIPLLELPEGREIVQDYAFQAVQRWSDGGSLSWACPTLKGSSIHQQRFALDLFYIYLYSIPDPFEASMLYQKINERLTILQSRVSLAQAMTQFYSSAAGTLKLSDFPAEEYSEEGMAQRIRAIKEAARAGRRGL
jgi:hypothetical protein